MIRRALSSGENHDVLGDDVVDGPSDSLRTSPRVDSTAAMVLLSASVRLSSTVTCKQCYSSFMSTSLIGITLLDLDFGVLQTQHIICALLNA